MNRVCLITPPSPFLLDEFVFPSLGILKVGASLLRAGLPVEHLDLTGVPDAATLAARHAYDSSATVFALTATSPQMPSAREIAEAIRDVRPDARLILGGPHATLVNAGRRGEEARGVSGGRAQRALAGLAGLFDTLVAGDGELSAHAAIRPDAPNLIDGDDPKSPLFLTNEALDETPFPARELLDLESYHYEIDGERSTSCIAQLGCPYQCTFCGGRNSAMLRRIRMRSTASVLAEMRALNACYGYRGVMFYDDELNVNKQMIPLMDGIAALGDELGFRWRLRGFIKSNLFTPEQAAAMVRAGFRWILVGFESGSERILENIQKKATRAQNSRCMEIARAAGLKVKALMSIGHAGESLETVCETRDWLLAERPDDFDCTVISCYPGTPYHDHAEQTGSGIWTYTARNGDRLHMEDVDFSRKAAYYKGVPGAYVSHVWTDYVSAAELVRARDALEADVRAALRIPYPAAVAKAYDATMGQTPRVAA